MTQVCREPTERERGKSRELSIKILLPADLGRQSRRAEDILSREVIGWHKTVQPININRRSEDIEYREVGVAIIYYPTNINISRRSEDILSGG
jgi:hypothetical protein